MHELIAQPIGKIYQLRLLVWQKPIAQGKTRRLQVHELIAQPIGKIYQLLPVQ